MMLEEAGGWNAKQGQENVFGICERWKRERRKGTWMERKGARSSVPPPSDLMWDPLRDGSHVSLLLWCPTATLKRGGETRKKWVTEFPGIPCHLICRPDAPLPPLMWLPRPQRPPECAAPLISRPKTNIRGFGIQHSNYRKRTHGATGEPHEPDVDTLCLCLLSCWHESRFLSAASCDLLRKKGKKNAVEDFENPQHLLEI